jgi:hypothetical protein
MSQPDEAHYRKEDLPENQRDSTADVAAKIMEGSEGMPIESQSWRPPSKTSALVSVKQVERLVNFQGKPEAYKHGC